MKHALIKVNLDDSHISENSKSPNLDDKIRLERRWRRREARNDSLKNNHVASVKRTTTKICGNTSVSIDKNDHMIDDEIDEDWANFLATYTGDDDDNDHVIDDEIDEDWATFLATYTGDDDGLANYNPDSGADRASNQSRDSDEVDPDYGSYLATYDPEIGADRASNQSGDSDEADPDYASYLATLNPDIEIDCASNHSGDSDETDPDYASYLATLNPDIEIDCASNHSGDSDDTDPDYASYLATLNPDIEIDCASNHSNGSNIDADFGNNSQDRSNSSDSDLIVMDSIPICENTPFISSKAYDLSCFGEEMNTGNMHDKMQISACYDSQFRRSLMEHLDKPYDQEEYDRLMLDISKRHLKERHVETRQGVVKSYRSKGVCKSYLDWYPDLEKAIAKLTFKEKHRVLFLLRGFYFWNTHVDHPGRFQPWLDKQCLEKLRKM